MIELMLQLIRKTSISKFLNKFSRETTRGLDPSLDVALLKLKSPVPIEKFNDSLYYYANMICLPPNNITPTKEEYIFASGWGDGHENHLKIGTRILEAGLTRGILNMNHTFHTHSIVENGTYLAEICSVICLIFSPC